MVTIEQVKHLILKQNEEAAEAITRAKDKFKQEGDLKFLQNVETLELVIKINEELLRKLDHDEFIKASQEDLQSWYNTLLSHTDYFQGSN